MKDKKQQKRLMPINEFAKFSGVETSVLRYYDDIGLFCPSGRGENNYRYYTPEQIIPLNMIQVLRDLDMPLKKIAALSKDRTPELLLTAMQEQTMLLDAKMRRLQNSYSILHMMTNNMLEGIFADETAILEEDLEDRPMILGAVNDFKDDPDFYNTFVDFCNQLKEMRASLSFPIGGYFKSMEAFLDAPSQPTRFFSTDVTGTDKRAAGRYLTGYTRGYYGDMNDLPERLSKYAEENRLVLGAAYVLYFYDKTSVKEPDRYLANITVEIKSGGRQGKRKKGL
ncbi:MAG: MerR family transcriptional regulator [Clostridiales bacterium]|jgi:DNA-binding transcriptional MerR regulator|nr:MerR family transcriptional regulator [Clostridiales bacterium]